MRVLEMGQLFYTAQSKLYLSNIFSIDYNRYFGNGEMWMKLNYFVQIANFFFGLSWLLTENICLNYGNQLRRYINLHRSSCKVSLSFVRF
jgi:hypothetical protein